MAQSDTNTEFLFDPFGLHEEGEEIFPDPEPQLPPSADQFVADFDDDETPNFDLPPKLVVKFLLFEEVSSMAKTGAGNSGVSEIFAKGQLSAHVTSSDATKNAPFCLLAGSETHSELQFEPNKDYASVPSTSLPPGGISLVHIPKTQIAPVPIGFYTISEQVKHMPILVERKITMYGTNVKVAIQVRSKLSNRGDLRDFDITIAIPERVDGDSIEVVRGNGTYDNLKRSIRWSLAHLPKGESFMVSVQAQLWSKSTPDDRQSLRFPAMLRCESDADQVSTVTVRAAGADGFPAIMTFSTERSFRLLHRLT